MSIKIIVADDSPTIQKVVDITLTNSSYNLIEAISLDKLTELISTEKPHLVLLDFSLDRDVNGYQISKAIKDESPLTKIIMMFGTFDEFSLENLKTFGVEGHVVKPFESKSLTSLCDKVLNDDEIALGDMLQDKIISDWQVDSNDDFVTIPNESEFSVSFEENELSGSTGNSKNFKPSFDEVDTIKEARESSITFDFEVPEKISGNKQPNIELPPFLSNENNIYQNKLNEDVVEIEQFPTDDDLEYPSFDDENIIEEKLPDNSDLEFPKIESSNNLHPLNVVEDSVNLENIYNKKQEFAVLDDMDNLNSEDFWSIDSDDNIQREGDPVDNSFESTPDNDKVNNAVGVISENFNTDNITNDLFNRLKPELDKKIKTYCEQLFSEYAKNSFPDLANSIIEKEIKKLTDLTDLS